MLQELDPYGEVPDGLYLSAIGHAASPQENAFRDVLVFHRDFLNGGLDQALFNRRNVGERVESYVAAYRAIGLPAVAGLIEDAVVRADAGGDLDECDQRYQSFTYGTNDDQPDAVEAAALRFAQQNEGAFTSIVGAWKRGGYPQLDFGTLF